MNKKSFEKFIFNFICHKRKAKTSIFYIKLNVIFFFFIILIYSFLSFLISSDYESHNIKKNNFYEILPKINSTNINNISKIEKIFNSKQLFITDINLTSNYVYFIREIKEKNKKDEKDQLEINKKEIKFNLDYFKNRDNIANNINFTKLCNEEKLLESNNLKDFKPIISVILPTFNKSDVIMKSVRSIQNQSFKNIEIIIVDDCSTDNSSLLFKD